MQNQNESIRGGTTVCIAILTQTEEVINLYIANVGDSFAMIINPLKNSFQILSQAHNLESFQEKNRVESSGGVILYIRNKPRINGSLNITRAIGNAKYKNIVISYPYISHIELPNNLAENTEDKYYLLLGTDGLLEKLSFESMFEIFMEHYKKNQNLEWISSCLCESAILSGSRDNLTAMIIDIEIAPKIKIEKIPSPSSKECRQFQFQDIQQ